MTTKSNPGEQETGEHSPLPWSIRDRDNLEFGKSITIDTGGPHAPSTWGGVASVINAAKFMSSTPLQEDRHQTAIANAELIVNAVNSHAELERERDALREALTELAGKADRASLVQDRSVRLIKQACAYIAKEARTALGETK